jgi:hypothetical protein
MDQKAAEAGELADAKKKATAILVGNATPMRLMGQHALARSEWSGELTGASLRGFRLLSAAQCGVA